MWIGKVWVTDPEPASFVIPPKRGGGNPENRRTSKNSVKKRWTLYYHYSKSIKESQWELESLINKLFGED